MGISTRVPSAQMVVWQLRQLKLLLTRPAKGFFCEASVVKVVQRSLLHWTLCLKTRRDNWYCKDIATMAQVCGCLYIKCTSKRSGPHPSTVPASPANEKESVHTLSWLYLRLSGCVAPSQSSRMHHRSDGKSPQNCSIQDSHSARVNNLYIRETSPQTGTVRLMPPGVSKLGEGA